MPRPEANYKAVSLRAKDHEALDRLAADTGLSKGLLFRKLIKFGRANIRELLLIDVPLANTASQKAGVHADSPSPIAGTPCSEGTPFPSAE